MYFLKRYDDRHGNGDYHYGTPEINRALQDAAQKFWDEYNSSNVDQLVPFLMVINDQSLEWGGLFDCSKTSNWDSPHQTHREGRNVDIPWRYYSIIDGYMPKEGPLSEDHPITEALFDALTEAGLDPKKEQKIPDHWHCTY